MQDESRFGRSCCFGRKVTHLNSHVLSHSYTNTNPLKTYLFAAKKNHLADVVSWEGVQRKKNEPEWPSSQERNVILHTSIGFVFLLTLSKDLLPHRHGTHEKLCRAILDLADCVDGSPWSHRVMEL